MSDVPAEMATWPHHESSRFVHAGGMRWHVQRMGSGPVLLLIHGTGASTHSWRHLMSILSQHYSIIAADLPGHAFTGPAHPRGSSIEGMSGLLSQLLGALDARPAYCVGHSAGAVVLAQMAIDGHIAPRVIVGINGAFLPMSGFAGRLLLAPIARRMAESPWVARLAAQRAANRANIARLLASTGSTLDDDGIDLYARLARNPRHVAGALRMMGHWDLHQFNRVLPRLTLPLTLLVGDNDLMVPPRQADEVAHRVVRVHVRRFAGLGHLAHEENPSLVAAELMSICAAHAQAA